MNYAGHLSHSPGVGAAAREIVRRATLSHAATEQPGRLGAVSRVSPRVAGGIISFPIRRSHIAMIL